MVRGFICRNRSSWILSGYISSIHSSIDPPSVIHLSADVWAVSIIFVFLFIFSSVRLSVCPSVRPSVLPSVRPSVRLSVSLSVRLSTVGFEEECFSSFVLFYAARPVSSSQSLFWSFLRGSYQLYWLIQPTFYVSIIIFIPVFHLLSLIDSKCPPNPPSNTRPFQPYVVTSI